MAAWLNKELGLNTITGKQNNDAVRNSDIAVLTVVYTAHRAAVESLKTDLFGKILINATARIDFRNPKPPEPPSAAENRPDYFRSGYESCGCLQKCRFTY